MDGSRYRPWAELLKRTYGIDVETCPRALRAPHARSRSRPTVLAEQERAYTFMYYYLPSYGFALVLLAGCVARFERKHVRQVLLSWLPRPSAGHAAAR